MNLSRNYEIRSLAGEHIIIPVNVKDVDFTHIFSLNEMAVNIWKIMEQGDFTVDSVIDSVAKEFEVTYEQAEKDVEEFVEQLKERGIVSD